MALRILEQLFFDFEKAHRMSLSESLKEIAAKDDTVCHSEIQAVNFDAFTLKCTDLTDKQTRKSVDAALIRHDKNEFHYVEFKGFNNLHKGYTYLLRTETEKKFIDFIKEKFVSFDIRQKIEHSVSRTLLPFIEASEIEAKYKAEVRESVSESGKAFESDYFVFLDCPAEDYEMFRLLTLDEVFSFKLPYLKSEPKLIFEYH